MLFDGLRRVRGLTINLDRYPVGIGERDQGCHTARRIYWESVGIALQCEFRGRWPGIRKPLAIEKDDIFSDQRRDCVHERRRLTKVQESPAVVGSRSASPRVVQLGIVPWPRNFDLLIQAGAFEPQESNACLGQEIFDLLWTDAVKRFTSVQHRHSAPQPKVMRKGRTAGCSAQRHRGRNPAKRKQFHCAACPVASRSSFGGYKACCTP